MLLVLDTSTSHTSVGLFLDDGVLVANSDSSTIDSHNEELASVVSQLILPKLGDQDISTIIVGLGPGSFTGLRIGLSFAKGFAFAKGIKLVGLSTFESVAAKLSHESQRSVLVHSDARRSERFACLASGDSYSAGIKILSAEEISKLEESIRSEAGSIVNLDVPQGLVESLCWAYLNRPSLVSMALPPEYLDIKPLYVRAVSARTIEERQASRAQ